MHIIRHRIYHQGTFEYILDALPAENRYHRAFGALWEPVYQEDGVTIYQRVDSDLAWLEERIEEYEQYFYSLLVTGICDKDGLLRSRTRDLHYSPAGFRQTTF